MAIPRAQPSRESVQTSMTSDKLLNTFNVGDRVNLKSLAAYGRIIEGPDSKGRYLVLIGSMKTWHPGQDLKGQKPSKKSPTSGLKKKSGQKLSPPSVRLDLHGKTKAEALEMLDDLLDKALLHGNSQLEIIHGLGTGVLKQVVTTWAEKQRQIHSFKLAEGNPGTTICFL